MLARTLLLVCLLAACQNRPLPSSVTERKASQPLHLDDMRALLTRYSRGGDYIVSSYEALPTSYTMKGKTFTVERGGFTEYFTSPMPDYLVMNMGTAVHETYHLYANAMTYQILARDDRFAAPFGEHTCDLGDGLIHIVQSENFPAREMDATFPQDARTFRYETYVSPSRESQSTQAEGVYGLLDEFTAYYFSARTSVDFWPWIRDESPININLMVAYVVDLHESWVPYAEFKLYILHYLLHAKTHHPEMYEGIIASQGFREAFRATDEAYSSLLNDAAALEPTVHQFAQSFGVSAELRDGKLYLHGSPTDYRSTEYEALLRYLESEPYLEIFKDLE